MSLMEAAELAGTASDLTILISQQGSIQMIARSDWELDSLQSHYGARTVYRVGENCSKVRVEGREAGRSCVLETEAYDRAARVLLGQAPRRSLAASPGLIA